MLDTYRHIWRPADRPEAPVLILLHGTGGHAHDMVRLGQAVAPGAGLLALEGDVDEHGQARFFRRRGEGLYDMEDLAQRIARFEAFLDAAMARYAIFAERAIGIGYSNGANMLAAHGFEHPSRFAKLGLMHPLIPWTPEVQGSSGRQRVSITAGQSDPICPPAMTEALAEAYRRHGADLTVDWHPGGHEIRPGEIETMRALVTSP
ncbi:MAG: alpha/beta hydrolase [Pseudomonadota bacterium]